MTDSNDPMRDLKIHAIEGVGTIAQLIVAYLKKQVNTKRTDGWNVYIPDTRLI